MTETFDFDGRYGAGYEALSRTVIPGYLSSFRQSLALLQGQLAEEARVLIVGAGTGIEIVTFGSVQPEWRFVGVDPSEQMLQIAQARIAEAGLESAADLHVGYVDELSAAGFDAATCFNVMHFLPDDGAKGALLRSIADRLDPGAPFVLFDLHGDPATSGFAEQFDAWRRYWRLQGMDEAASAEFEEKIERGIEWIPERRVLDLIESAGFVECRRFFRGLLYGAWIAQKGST